MLDRRKRIERLITIYSIQRARMLKMHERAEENKEKLNSINYLAWSCAYQLFINDLIDILENY